MEVNGFFYEIFVNETSIGLAPSTISFSLRDSIHSVYPSCTFAFDDYTGLIFEGKGVTEGMPIEVHLGMAEAETISCPYVVKSYELPKTKSPGNLNGVVNGELIHAFANTQEIKSFSYTGKISDVVKEVVSPFPYKDVIIEDTANDDIWYRPLTTQHDFVTKILLENAYSYNSAETPFFCFTDSNNAFHFETYNTLFSKSVTGEFTYKVVNRTTADNSVVYDLKPFTASMPKYKKDLNRYIHYMSQVDGSLVEEEDSILAHPPNNGDKLPYIGDPSLFTGKQFLYLYEEESPDKENLLGRKLNALRQSFFMERFILTTNLRVDILSGSTIDLKTISFDDQGEVNSLYHSGKYLVERSSHVWNGEKQIGTSQFIIARKYVTVPDNYLVKENLYQ